MCTVKIIDMYTLPSYRGLANKAQDLLGTVLTGHAIWNQGTPLSGSGCSRPAYQDIACHFHVTDGSIPHELDISVGNTGAEML